MIIYLIVESKQPKLIEKMRQRWPGWRPPWEPEPAITLDDKAFRDVTDQVAAAAADHNPSMGHSAYKRVNRRVRQVRQG